MVNMKILAHRDDAIKLFLQLYIFMMNFKYFLNYKSEIYYICTKRESYKKLIRGSTKPSKFLSTLQYAYQQSYLRNPFLNWIQGYFFLPHIQN